MGEKGLSSEQALPQDAWLVAGEEPVKTNGNGNWAKTKKAAESHAASTVAKNGG